MEIMMSEFTAKLSLVEDLLCYGVVDMYVRKLGNKKWIPCFSTSEYKELADKYGSMTETRWFVSGTGLHYRSVADSFVVTAEVLDFLKDNQVPEGVVIWRSLRDTKALIDDILYWAGLLDENYNIFLHESREKENKMSTFEVFGKMYLSKKFNIWLRKPGTKTWTVCSNLGALKAGVKAGLKEVKVVVLETGTVTQFVGGHWAKVSKEEDKPATQAQVYNFFTRVIG